MDDDIQKRNGGKTHVESKSEETIGADSVRAKNSSESVGENSVGGTQPRMPISEVTLDCMDAESEGRANFGEIHTANCCK